MLLVALLLMIVGFSLLYAGVHSGDTWKRPWQPFVDQLKTAA